MENQTPCSSASYQSALGIDVCAERLDLCWLPSCSKSSVENSAVGIADLLRQLAKAPPDIVVMEATGGLQRAVASAMAAAQHPVAVVNPRQVRDFAKACNRLAKTDVLDAETVALFGLQNNRGQTPIISWGKRTIGDRPQRTIGDRPQ